MIPWIRTMHRALCKTELYLSMPERYKQHQAPGVPRVCRYSLFQFHGRFHHMRSMVLIFVLSVVGGTIHYTVLQRTMPHLCLYIKPLRTSWETPPQAKQGDSAAWAAAYFCVSQSHCYFVRRRLIHAFKERKNPDLTEANDEAFIF